MYQSLTLVGNLGNDPEMRHTQSGGAVTNFSLATNRVWNVDGEKKTETTWFRISVWGPQAESANKYLTKGRQVLVEGRLKPDPNTGGPTLFKRQDGSYGAAFEVTAHTVRFLSGTGENGSGPHAASVSGPAASKEDEEVPF